MYPPASLCSFKPSEPTVPSQRDHEEKALSVERVLLVLDQLEADHWDWMAVLAFYAALHWLDAYLAHRGLHPTNHRERNRAAQGLPIWDEYYELYAMSRIARYEGGRVPQLVAIRMRDQNMPVVRAWTQQSKRI